MEKEKKSTVKKSAKSGDKKAVSFMEIVSGDFLVKEFVINNLPYIFFLIFLMLLIVSKGYYAKQLIQDINSTQKQLDAVTADFVESKAKLEEETTRSNLLDDLSEIGLKETTNPVKVIRVKKQND